MKLHLKVDIYKNSVEPLVAINTRNQSYAQQSANISSSNNAAQQMSLAKVSCVTHLFAGWSPGFELPVIIQQQWETPDPTETSIDRQFYDQRRYWLSILHTDGDWNALDRLTPQHNCPTCLHLHTNCHVTTLSWNRPKIIFQATSLLLHRWWSVAKDFKHIHFDIVVLGCYSVACLWFIFSP